MSRVSAGVQEVEIDGHEYTLKVTVFAMEQINRKFGDIYTALKACAEANAEAVIFVLSKASGAQKSRLDDLKEHVLREGIGPSGAIAIEYLNLLYDPSGSSNENEEEDSGE